jgi:hypothetical protein
MLETAKEIYGLGNVGQITGQELIVNKIKQIVEADRKRIAENAKPLTFEKIPWKLRLFFTKEILFNPNKFIETFSNSIFLLFLSSINDEQIEN